MPRTERLKKKRNGKMKLTKSKLKQLIKEAFEDEEGRGSLTYPSGERFGLTGELPRGEERYSERGPPDKPMPGEKWWVTEMAQLAHDADALYKNMPDEGKQLLTENFETYVEEWKKEQAGYPEEEDDEDDENGEEEDEGEYEMLPRGEDPMGRGPQTSQLRRKSTNWRPGEDFYGID
jgi:hypothetical protein